MVCTNIIRALLLFATCDAIEELRFGALFLARENLAIKKLSSHGNTNVET